MPQSLCMTAMIDDRLTSDIYYSGTDRLVLRLVLAYQLGKPLVARCGYQCYLYKVSTLSTETLLSLGKGASKGRFQIHKGRRNL